MENERKTEMAYLAGVLDGDGSYSIIKRTACMGPEKRRIPRYRPCIQMFNLSEEMTQLLKTHLGGNIGKRNSQKLGWKSQCYWYCVGLKSCKYALDMISPFIIVKKEMADLLMRFVTKGLELYQAKKLDDSVIFDREKDYLKMKFLNQKRDISPESISIPSKKDATPEEWAYIAGLMDTDGSFQISRTIRKGRKQYSYESRATIQMLSILGLDFIYGKTRLGNISLITRGRGSNCRQMFHYRWILTSRDDILVFVKGILPFIKYKKNQCIVLVDYINLCNNQERYKSSSNELDVKEAFYTQIKHLNKYGVYKPSLIDLEAQKQGNKGEGESHAERLNERGAGDSACESLITTNSLEGKS